MNRAFVYPKTKHVRHQTPPQLPRYQDYKPYLRVEFYRICVYCRKPDGQAAAQDFGVDHYLPKKQFPRLETHYPNLYYCCNACNSRKSGYWPKKPTALALPNPCDHEMFAHMRFQRCRVVARTPMGDFAVKRFDLNDPTAIAQRDAHLACIEALEATIEGIKKKAKRIDEKRRAGTISPAVAANAKAELDAFLVRNKAALEHLGVPT
jgi:hypothetical protein